MFFFTIFISNNLTAQEIPEDINTDISLILEYNSKGIEAGSTGNWELAKSYFIKTLELRKEIYGNQSPEVARSLTNIGITNKNLGNYKTATENYLEAEKIYINSYNSNYPRLGGIYINLGNIYKIQGDYTKYKNYQENAIRIYSLDEDNYTEQISDAKYNLAESLYLLKRYDEAIKICNQNLNKVSAELQSYYTSLIARIYEETNEYELADRYYQETFRLIIRDYGQESDDLGLEYINYVEFLLKAQRYDDALRYNQLADNLIAKYYTKQSKNYSEILTNYGKYYQSKISIATDNTSKHKKEADISLALNYFQKALIANSTTFSDTNIYVNPKTEEAISDIIMLEILNQKAECFENLGNINLDLMNDEEAIKSYQASLNTINISTEYIHQIRTGFISEESQIFLSENQESTFLNAVKICYKLYKQTSDFDYALKAFEFTEESKSASFLAAVKDSRAQEFGGVPDSLINKEDALKINISNYKEMLFEENQKEEPDPEITELYNSKIFQYSDEYDKLISYLEENYPNYYSFKYKNEVVDIESIREKLKSHDAIVEYLIEEPKNQDVSGKLFRFIITNTSFSFTAQEIKYDFVENIESISQFLTNPGYLYTGINEYNNYVTSAHQLYQDLLGCVKEKIPGRRLIIIPDDKLSYIPFDALLSEEPDTTRMNFRDLPYLVNDYSISYTYSTTLLYNYFEKGKEASKDLLAFAPNYLNDDRDSNDMSTFRAGLSPLPAVEKEVEYISNYISGDIFKNEYAQESEFKKTAKDYDIIHLAMHTILNDSLPMYSRLAFAKPLENDENDGWLNTSEIYTMELNARMAVLSACNTGSGKLQKGEGVMSLARGFLYAGCPSIIMTLWEVEDESGALIMKDFYQFLSNGKNKDEALRLAKLNHIQNADPLKAHPHYWLGYVAVGNSAPLYTSNNWYLLLIILGIIAVISLDQIYRKRNKSQTNSQNKN